MWSPTWWAIMKMGGFDPAAGKQGAYAGLVHGIVSPAPSPSPSPPQSPQLEAPPQPNPTNPPEAFAKALGAIPPALDRQGTVCSLCSSVDLANRSSFDLPTVAARSSLEHRSNFCLERT